MRKILKKDEAQRLVDWLLAHGHTNEEANEALSFVIGVMKQKKENPATAKT